MIYSCTHFPLHIRLVPFSRLYISAIVVPAEELKHYALSLKFKKCHWGFEAGRLDKCARSDWADTRKVWISVGKMLRSPSVGDVKPIVEPKRHEVRGRFRKKLHCIVLMSLSTRLIQIKVSLRVVGCLHCVSVYLRPPGSHGNSSTKWNFGWVGLKCRRAVVKWDTE